MKISSILNQCRAIFGNLSIFEIELRIPDIYHCFEEPCTNSKVPTCQGSMRAHFNAWMMALTSTEKPKQWRAPCHFCKSWCQNKLQSVFSGNEKKEKTWGNLNSESSFCTHISRSVCCTLLLIKHGVKSVCAFEPWQILPLKTDLVFDTHSLKQTNQGNVG